MKKFLSVKGFMFWKDFISINSWLNCRYQNFNMDDEGISDVEFTASSSEDDDLMPYENKVKNENYLGRLLELNNFMRLM